MPRSLLSRLGSDMQSNYSDMILNISHNFSNVTTDMMRSTEDIINITTDIVATSSTITSTMQHLASTVATNSNPQQPCLSVSGICNLSSSASPSLSAFITEEYQAVMSLTTLLCTNISCNAALDDHHNSTTITKQATDMDATDDSWILTSAVIIFTMQTGEFMCI